MGLCYHISGAHGPIIRLKSPRELFDDPVTPKVNSILHLAIILDIHAVFRFYFEYDVAVGLFYQTL